MKILILVNWKVEYANSKPKDKQPPDYYLPSETYWFFKYFKEKAEVDVIDIHSCSFLESFEKNKLRFYIYQTLRAIPKLKHYDYIISHGMQSAVVLSFYRRIFHKHTPPHIVFEIGSFNSGAESGFAYHMMQFASKSIDGYIYHSSQQIEFYKKNYPWIVNKSKFIHFGTDSELFCTQNNEDADYGYILCIGYAKRDWDTLIKAYNRLKTKIKLVMIGNTNLYTENKNIQFIPFVKIKELIGYINGALFSVLPLEYMNYSFGQMTLLQQMALGKAVITARVPSMLDYIDDKKNGLFYEPKNEIDLAEKMKLLIEDSVLRDEIALQAQKDIKTKYNEHVMAAEVEDFLKTL